MPLTEIKKPITVKGDDSKDNLGLVHVITGDGRGKTTSSLGLGLRAIGNNLRVHMVQFLKSGFTGELYSAKKLGFEIEQFGVDALKEKQQKLQEFEDKTSRFVFQPDIKEKDAALERRFQTILIDEPSISETIEIIKGNKALYEEHHNVIYTEKAIEQAKILKRDLELARKRQKQLA